MNTQKYHITLRILHWLIAIIMLSTLIAGFVMENVEPETRSAIIGWHITGGLTVLFLAVARLIARFTFALPPLPADLKPLEAKAGTTVHYLFYVIMICLPLSGYTMTVLRGHTPKWLGLEMPTFALETNREIAGIAYQAHEYLAFAFIALLTLHVAAALKHLVFDKTNLFKRIT
jgi:cytochrome b561